MERDGGLHCAQVEAAVTAHPDDEVMWGNGEAVADELRSLGVSRSLAEWLDTLDPHLDER